MQIDFSDFPGKKHFFGLSRPQAHPAEGSEERLKRGWNFRPFPGIFGLFPAFSMFSERNQPESVRPFRHFRTSFGLFRPSFGPFRPLFSGFPTSASSHFPALFPMDFPMENTHLHKIKGFRKYTEIHRFTDPLKTKNQSTTYTTRTTLGLAEGAERLEDYF